MAMQQQKGTHKIPIVEIQSYTTFFCAVEILI